MPSARLTRVLLSLVFVTTGCDGCREAATGLGAGSGLGIDRPPWIRSDGATRMVSGHVVTADGEPIEGAVVQLIYPGDPHWPEEVAYAETTDAAGAFSITASPSHFNVVVRHLGEARTFDPPFMGYDPNQRVPAMTIRFAPTRPVEISAECTVPPLEDIVGDPDPVAASFYWAPGDDLFAKTYLGARDHTGDHSDAVESRVQPGRVTYVPSLPAAARQFGATVAVPRGHVVAIFSGGCGTARRELEPGEDATEIALSLPEPDASSLVIRMASDQGDTVRRPAVHFGAVRVDTHEDVRVGRAMRLERLAPGRYEIPETACIDPIELPPSSETIVTIAPGRCDVRSGPLPDPEQADSVD